MPKCKPITIRGVTYESVRAAARALEVGFSTIYQAKSRGYMDTVGLSKTPGYVRKKSDVIPSHRGIMVDDKFYNTFKEAAEFFGMLPTNFSKVIKRYEQRGRFTCKFRGHRLTWKPRKEPLWKRQPKSNTTPMSETPSKG